MKRAKLVVSRDRGLGCAILLLAMAALIPAIPARAASQPIIINHTCTDLSLVPGAWITQAKSALRVTYGHTSHGSQLVSGIETFQGSEGSLYYYTYSGGGYNAGVFLNDYSPDGDLGSPDRTTWAARTRQLLNRAGGCNRNVVMWSWCGQAETSDPADITTYLNLMNQLESDFPSVTFVYMTGHLVGSGAAGDLNQRNEQIRAYCQAHNKVLFDFADIESFDPGGGTNFMARYANDGCYYDTSGDGSPDAGNTSNWAYNWIQAHPGDPLAQLAGDCSSCAHSDAIPRAKLNCILKGRAFWWLMARLAGWNGSTGLQVTSPNGGESWIVGESRSITWSQPDGVAGVDIDYSTNGGSDWTSIAAGTANDGTYSWTVPDTPSSACRVRVRDAADGDPSDSSDAAFTIALPAETVSPPDAPSGPAAGISGSSYDFSTGGAASNLGHDLQYRFDWNDGGDSGWLATGTTGASHTWSANGTYNVRAMARCAGDTAVESSWSDFHAVVISAGGQPGPYNAPASRLAVTEVNWSTTSNWRSEVQITDLTGGSTVQAYYNCGTSRRGPFTLWVNGGGPGSGTSFANIVEAIDNLDDGEFTYYGTSGALELATQDGSHLIQAAVRTYSGNNSRTFPALADCETNTAAYGRQLLIPNLSNNASYRPSVVLFNPGTEAATVEVRLYGSDGGQIGSTVNRALAGHEMNVITSELRADTYGNASAVVTVASTTGRVLASGQTANNHSNDPAAHLAVQVEAGQANSYGQRKMLTEVNWSTSSNWRSEVQIVDPSGGAVVQAYYNCSGGRRGPFTLWANAGALSASFPNILETLDDLDPEPFSYYGTSGALELASQDGSHPIHAAVRTYSGNYSRTFPALGEDEANTAALGRPLLIPNLSNDAAYRPSVVVFNPSSESVAVEVRIIGSDGAQVGETITRSLDANQMSVITSEVRANAYSNACARVEVTSGAGWVLASGQTANNHSNDPAAHVAVRAE